MEVQWLVLRDSRAPVRVRVTRLAFFDRHGLHLPVHLVSRRKEKDRISASLADGLEHVQGSEKVDLEVRPRVID